MASSGSGKRSKTKWKPSTVDNVFSISRKTNWADEVEDEIGDAFDAKPSEKVVLPTAPRASCAVPVDESKVPTMGPFHAHVSNIPYEMLDDELRNLFNGLNIKDVRVPREERGGTKAKGYAYVEFSDRSSLISALQMGETILRGRSIRIELATDINRRGRGNQRGDMMGSRGDSSIDRTSGNWRSRDDDDQRGGGFDRPSRSFGGSGGGGSGGFSRGDSYGFRGGDDRGPSREDRYDRGVGLGREEKFGRGMGFMDRGYDDNSSFSRRDGGFRSERSDRDRDRGGFGRSDRSDGGSSRFMSRRDDPPMREPVSSSGGSSESRSRPKLALQPRSANLPPPTSGDPPPAAAAASSTPSSSIFGNAKPVDTLSKYLEIEERLSKPEFPPEKGRSSGSVSSIGSGSGSYMRSESLSSNERMEPRRMEAPAAPPPRENAWKPRNPPPAAHVNNGRSSPSEEPPPDSDKSVTEEELEQKKMEPHLPEEKGAVGGKQQLPTGPKAAESRPKPGPPGPPVSKNREPKKDIDDISKMPKVPDSQAPNFIGANKFSSLIGKEDAAGGE